MPLLKGEDRVHASLIRKDAKARTKLEKACTRTEALILEAEKEYGKTLRDFYADHP
jgi:hypothetical protein